MTLHAPYPAPCHERLHPRALTRHGVWAIGWVRMKMYGITEGTQTLPDDLLSKAQTIAAAHLETLSDDVTLGFVIVHPGREGTSILTLWWEQGSVLCQRVTRWAHESGATVDVTGRGVIGCVWELAVIAAEQQIWRRRMMGEAPSPEAYLGEMFTADHV
ncbi:MAG: hypothetical protein AAF919_06545 [Pseudomonadota bacterium]